jgi:ABC-type branched-subunit amino acid transport system substrate-binding protein
MPSYVVAARSAATSARAPRLYFSYLAEIAQLGELRDAATLAVWPGTRVLAAPAVPSRTTFVQSFTDRHGPPGTHAAVAYDALSLLAAAADRGVDAETLRARLEVNALVGAATTYTFSGSRHAGFAVADLALLRYTGPRSAPSLAPDPRLERQPALTP